MKAINSKVNGFYDQQEMKTWLEMFEQDLIIKIMTKVSKIEGKLEHQIEDKASRAEIKFEVSSKADSTELTRTKEKLLFIDQQLNSLLSKQEGGSDNSQRNILIL